VSTLAPHGTRATLLLDPATIEIVAASGSNPAVSYITVANLAAALASTDVTIDAVTPSFGSIVHTNGSGTDGTITVTDPFIWSGTGNLTLSAGAGGIVINAAITSTNATKANLNLVSDGSIRAETAVLTVGTLTATASSGSILLTGANGIRSLGNLSALLGEVTVRNAIALAVPNAVTEVTEPIYQWGRYVGIRYVQTSSRVTWQAARGVNLKLDNTNLTPAGNFDVKANYFRLDLGTGALLGGNTLNINALNLDVYFTGATSGHNGTIAICAGSFTWVFDKRGSSATVIDNNTTAALGWGTIGKSYTGSGSGGGEFSLAGLQVTSLMFTGGNDLRFGVVYGGTVEVQNISTGEARGLSYIEAPGIKVTDGSSFAGPLTLVSTGAGVTSLGVTAGIVIGGDLTVGTANDRTSHCATYGTHVTLRDAATTHHATLARVLGVLLAACRKHYCYRCYR
ncbi:MAG: hypothetical protein ORO03_00280, partial [Alphaproteobacteria bacterium]|nr:hypothetical protein [Alphaproteobacteria bacterium]